MAALGAWLTPTRACVRDTLILSFSHKGLAGVGLPRNGLGDLESAWLFRHLCEQQKPQSRRRFAMRFPSECYQIHQTIRQTMPHLSEAQLKGLALRRSEP